MKLGFTQVVSILYATPPALKPSTNVHYHPYPPNPKHNHQHHYPRFRYTNLIFNTAVVEVAPPPAAPVICKTPIPILTTHRL